MRVNIVTT